MSNRLIFDADWLVPEQVQVAGQAIQYYAARNIQYVQHPVAAIQVLNVFVPAAYLHGSSVNGYQRATAPILMPNTVGGYLPDRRMIRNVSLGRRMQGRFNRHLNAVTLWWPLEFAVVRRLISLGNGSGKRRLLS